MKRAKKELVYCPRCGKITAEYVKASYGGRLLICHDCGLRLPVENKVFGDIVGL